MRGMKTSMKTWLFIIVLALLACLVVLVSRPDEPAAPSVPDTSHSPSFEVHVVKPRLARPLFGILPTRFEKRLFGGGELRFDHTSRGAEVGGVGHDRLELRADGWDLLIETDGEGRVAPGTRLVFTMELAERRRTLRCRPAEPATGYLRATPRAGSGERARGACSAKSLSNHSISSLNSLALLACCFAASSARSAASQ